jgi:hypothetical protein
MNWELAMQSFIHAASSVFIGGIAIPSPGLDGKIDFITLCLFILAFLGVAALLRRFRDK